MWPSIEINIGSYTGQIHLYSVLMGCGLCHLFLGVDSASRSLGLNPKITGNYYYCLGFAFVGGIIFSKIVTRFFYEGDTPWGNMAAMPGIIGIALVLFVTARIYRLPIRHYLELTVPFFCFAHAWGRLGCFMAGCCHGVPTDNIIGVQFPENSPACTLHGYQPVHPTQLYEMVVLIFLGLLMQFIIPLGHRLYSYLIIYGVGRFAVEFLRGDNRGSSGFLLGLSPSQSLCILFILVGGVLVWWTRSKPLSHKEFEDTIE